MLSSAISLNTVHADFLREDEGQSPKDLIYHASTPDPECQDSPNLCARLEAIQGQLNQLILLTTTQQHTMEDQERKIEELEIEVLNQKHQVSDLVKDRGQDLQKGLENLEAERQEKARLEVEVEELRRAVEEQSDVIGQLERKLERVLGESWHNDEVRVECFQYSRFYVVAYM